MSALSRAFKLSVGSLSDKEGEEEKPPHCTVLLSPPPSLSLLKWNFGISRQASLSTRCYFQLSAFQETYCALYSLQHVAKWAYCTPRSYISTHVVQTRYSNSYHTFQVLRQACRMCVCVLTFPPDGFELGWVAENKGGLRQNRYHFSHA